MRGRLTSISGLSAGLDFETKIFVKERAPELLRDELLRRSWTPQTLVLSGITDPYQPIERRLELTRGCLRVLAEFRNPVALITKNALVGARRRPARRARLASARRAWRCRSPRSTRISAG